MEKEFTEWYKKEQSRFHSGQFDEKQIAYAAWLESKKQALSIANVVNRRELLLDFVSQLNRPDITQIEIGEYNLLVDTFLENL